jgi:hypothetical protein
MLLKFANTKDQYLSIYLESQRIKKLSITEIGKKIDDRCSITVKKVLKLAIKISLKNDKPNKKSIETCINRGFKSFFIISN